MMGEINKTAIKEIYIRVCRDKWKVGTKDRRLYIHSSITDVKYFNRGSEFWTC